MNTRKIPHHFSGHRFVSHLCALLSSLFAFSRSLIEVECGSLVEHCYTCVYKISFHRSRKKEIFREHSFNSLPGKNLIRKIRLVCTSAIGRIRSARSKDRKSKAAENSLKEKESEVCCARRSKIGFCLRKSLERFMLRVIFSGFDGES